jgi:hypothetical protein
VNQTIDAVLPGAANEVAQTVAENNSFRSRTKLSRDDRKKLTLGLCTRAFDRIRNGEKPEKVLFGLTPREKAYVTSLVAEYREWEKAPAAFTAASETPGQGA